MINDKEKKFCETIEKSIANNERLKKEFPEKWLIQEHLSKCYEAKEFLKKSLFYREETTKKHPSIFD